MYFLPKLFLVNCLVIIILEFSGKTAACGSLNKFLNKKKYQFTDLTFAVPKKAGVSADDELDDDWYVDLDSDTTHLKFGKEVEDIPKQNLIVALVYVDFSSKVNGNPNYAVSLDDFKSVLDNDIWNQINEEPTLLVINFGLSSFYYKDHDKYMGVCKDNETSVCLPDISPEAVVWLMSKDVNNHIVGMGSDRPVIDDLRDLHAEPMRKGMYFIYGLNLNTSLPSHGCTVVVSPLKVKTTAKTFVNVMVLCPDSKTESKNQSESSGHESHKSHKCMKHKEHSNHDIDQHIEEEIKEHFMHEIEEHHHEDKEHNHEDKGHNHEDKEHNHEDKGHNHEDKEHNHEDKGHNHEDKPHQTEKPQKVTTQGGSTESPNSHEVQNSKDKHKFKGPIGFILNKKDKLKL